MIQEIFKMLNQHTVDIPTFPVNLCLSHLIQILVECSAVLKHLGRTWFIGKRFRKSSGVFFITLSAGIESMELRNMRTDSFINGGEE